MIRSNDGGPPRWFSPLECRSRSNDSPLLLFLSELVKQVERTVRSENYRSPNRPIYLVGESLGGCLALAVAARNPDIDFVLILANPATCFASSKCALCDEFNLRLIEVATTPVMLSTLENGKIVKGLAGIPSEGPVLFGGYHMLLALEVIHLISSLWSERNILVRGIAHPMLFMRLKDGKLPDVSTFDLLRIMGAVPVSATNFYRLLSSKSHVLLYLGGMCEALHRKVFFDYDDQMKIPHFKNEIENGKQEAVQLRTDIDGEVANQDHTFH